MNSTLTDRDFKRGKERNPDESKELKDKYNVNYKTKSKGKKQKSKKDNSKKLKVQYLGRTPQNENDDAPFDLHSSIARSIDYVESRDVDFFELAFGTQGVHVPKGITVSSAPVDIIGDEMFPDLPVRDPSTIVDIRLPSGGKKQFVCIPKILLEQLDEDPKAIKHYERDADGAFQPATRGDARAAIMGVAKSLLKLGLDEGDRICIMGSTQSKWCYAHLGAQFVRCVGAGIYKTSSPDQVSFIVNDCDAKVVLFNDEEMLIRNEEILSELKSVETIVVMNGDVSDDRAITWEQFLEIGAGESEEDIINRIDNIAPEDCVTLIYTSGTTGPPKGVMLSSGNVEWVARVLTEDFATSFGVPDNADYVSYLPLSHVAEQVLTIYGPSCNTKITPYFCHDTSELAATLAEVKPHILFAPPRLWEKFFAGISAKLPPGVPLDQIPQETKNAITGGLGLGRCKMAMTGAAPISSTILEFFGGLGVNIAEIYGQSEGTGPTSFNVPGATLLGSVGKAVPDTEIVIAEDGELLFRGPQVFLGYWNQPEKTAETLDSNGFVHSGDLATIDDEGFVHIVGRKKDIIITSGGKNITPINMENALKAHPLIGASVVVGEGRPYLNALISIDQDVAAALAAKHEVTVEQFLASPGCQEAIDAHVNKTNEGFNRQEQVKKYKILDEPISVENGVMTPTFKVKRSVANDYYADIIDQLYAEE